MKLTQLGYTCIKPENSRVFIPTEMATEAYNKVAKHIRILEQAAKVANKDILFVPKNEKALMNFGPYTALINVKGSDKEVLTDLETLIRKTFNSVSLNSKNNKSEEGLFKLYI